MRAFIKRQNADLKIAKVTIQNMKTRKARRRGLSGRTAARKKSSKSTITASKAKAKRKTNRKLTRFFKKLKGDGTEGEAVYNFKPVPIVPEDSDATEDEAVYRAKLKARKKAMKSKGRRKTKTTKRDAAPYGL